MSRRMFGWDLPPGCTQRHIDEAAGGYDEEPENDEPSMTHVVMRGTGGEIGRVSMSYNDATTEAIAQAAIDLIRSCYSMSEGDTISVETE